MENRVLRPRCARIKNYLLVVVVDFVGGEQVSELRVIRYICSPIQPVLRVRIQVLDRIRIFFIDQSY